MAEAGSPASRRTVIRDILCYLLEHPDAKDTRDGILRWWIPQGRDEPDIQTMQDALDDLVAKGWMFKREAVPNRVIYS
ncbi:MAG: hypothetical protein M3Z35_08550, partial [Nitrospirota bacterium]|nr:hypothetical protein [Nitrospirota bacterium]